MTAKELPKACVPVIQAFRKKVAELNALASSPTTRSTPPAAVPDVEKRDDAMKKVANTVASDMTKLTLILDNFACTADEVEGLSKKIEETLGCLIAAAQMCSIESTKSRRDMCWSLVCGVLCVYDKFLEMVLGGKTDGKIERYFAGEIFEICTKMMRIPEDVAIVSALMQNQVEVVADALEELTTLCEREGKDAEGEDKENDNETKDNDGGDDDDDDLGAGFDDFGFEEEPLSSEEKARAVTVKDVLVAVVSIAEHVLRSMVPSKDNDAASASAAPKRVSCEWLESCLDEFQLVASYVDVVVTNCDTPQSVEDLTSALNDLSGATSRLLKVFYSKAGPNATRDDDAEQEALHKTLSELRKEVVKKSLELCA